MCVPSWGVWPAPEPTCWLHPEVEVRASPVAGVGLFARAPIPAGTGVSRIGGRLVTGADLERLFAANAKAGSARLTPRSDPAQASTTYVDTVTVTDGLHLVLPPGTPNGKGNHGCDPNLWWSDPYTLGARRDIGAGEELFNDYATSTGSAAFTMSCRCGSPLCRRTITGQDWRRVDLQQRYGDHWVPALLRRIREAAGTGGG
jgi:uncharacterized protein